MFEAITHPQRRAFLAAYAECGVVTEAAAIAGISREAHYDWKRDPQYAEAFQLADQMAGDALEAEARRRAMVGQNDKVLMFLLRGAKPEKYSTKKIEQTGPDGGPIQSKIEVIVRSVLDDVS